MKPVKAKVFAVAWWVDCPKCKEGLPATSGSLMWAPEDRPRTVECACGATVSVPEAK